METAIRTTVTFKKDTSKVKFFKDQTADLRTADNMLNADFAGMEHDPNFDAGVDGFIIYLEEFTPTKWNEFSDEQIDVIKEIFCL